MDFLQYLYWALLAVVIVGHFFFAYGQIFKWRALCAKLTDLTGDAVEKSAFLGRSIGSYNASIGIGLLGSLWLDQPAQDWVQGVVLALIVATACVGAMGTRTNTILKLRLTPAALALIALVLLNLTAPAVN